MSSPPTHVLTRPFLFFKAVVAKLVPSSSPSVKLVFRRCPLCPSRVSLRLMAAGKEIANIPLFLFSFPFPFFPRGYGGVIQLSNMELSIGLDPSLDPLAGKRRFFFYRGHRERCSRGFRSPAVNASTTMAAFHYTYNSFHFHHMFGVTI